MVSSFFLLFLAAGFLSAGLGDDMDVKEAPWHVSLRLKGAHYCSGAIYSENIVITAAQCFYKRTTTAFYRHLHAAEISIVAGTSYRSSWKNIQAAKAIKHHDKFKMGSAVSAHDIGIIKLVNSFKLNAFTKAIPLHEGNFFGYQLLTGWGLTDSPKDDYIYPEKLQGFRVGTINCQPKMSDDIYCAKPISHRGGCGDPGSPLVVNRRSLVGVGTGGNPNCRDMLFFTSVPFYSEWITDAIDSI